jgi:molecular chaperone IbpA
MRQSLFNTVLFPLDIKDTKIFDEINRVANKLHKNGMNYPPYNIFRNKDDVVYIELGVSGFDKSEISVYIDDLTLNIEGTKKEDFDDKEIEYLHRGLGKRNFKQKFEIAKNYNVTEVTIKDGILLIKLEPKEQLKQYIEIS